VAERKAAKEREPELEGFEAGAGGGTRPVEQRAAELRRRELGEQEDGHAEGQDSRAGGQEAAAPQRVSAACSIARA
jgi:hypothetical protein